MLINFYKLHALGNDFIIITNLFRQLKPFKILIQRLCDRKLGIGCDQLLIIEPPKNDDADFWVKIFNQDGSFAKNCLNGIRCVGRLVWDLQLSYSDNLNIDIVSGRVKVNYTKDNFINTQIQLPINHIASHTINNNFYLNQKIYCLDIGNLHALIFLPAEKVFPENLANEYQDIINKLPELINYNISWIKPNVINNKPELNIRVFEAGVGETLACGSAAMAAGIIAVTKYNFPKNLKINFMLGSLNFIYPNQLSGPTNRVFNGKFRV